MKNYYQEKKRINELKTKELRRKYKPATNSGSIGSKTVFFLICSSFLLLNLNYVNLTFVNLT